MQRLSLAAIAAAAALAASASAASAAPASGFGKALGETGLTGNVIQVHGRHVRCELGRGGWHRSPARGVRIACRPPRPRGAFWIWRSEGPRHGWYHRKERRWWR